MGSPPIIGAQQLNPQPNLVDQMMRLRGMQQEEQLRQQQIQGAQQENQQRAIQMKDQEAMTKAMQGWDPAKPEELPSLILKHGGSANAVFATQQQILSRKQTLSEIAKDDALTGNTKLESLEKQHDLLLGKLNTVTDGPSLIQAAKSAAEEGLIDPQHAQLAEQMAQLPPDKFKLALDSMKKELMGQKAQMQQVKDEADQAAKAAELPGKQAESRIKTAEANAAEQFGAATQQQKENRYQSVLQKLNARQPVSQEDLDFAHGYELANRKSTTTSDSLGVSSTNTSGPSGLSAAQPRQAGTGTGGAKGSAKDSIVDMIGQYRADPALISRMFMKHPDILGMIQQKYPDFDQTSYIAKNKLIQGMTSGSQSKEINAINTVMGHIGVMDEAVDAMKNGDIRLLNQIGNRLGIEVGQTPVAAFRAIVHRVGPEITTAYVQGGGGEAERFANAKDFDPNLSPDILHNNAAITVKMLRSKIGALENQYKNTVGRDDFAQRFLTPEAKASLERFAGKGATGQQGTPQMKPPAGATMKVPGSDGKMHWSDGKQDLGVVQ